MYPSVDTNQLVAHGCSSLRFDVLGCLKENLQETPQNKRVVSCILHVPLKLAQVHKIRLLNLVFEESKSFLLNFQLVLVKLHMTLT